MSPTENEIPQNDQPSVQSLAASGDMLASVYDPTGEGQVIVPRTILINRPKFIADLKTTNTPAQNTALINSTVAAAKAEYGAGATVYFTPGTIGNAPSVGGIRELVGLGSGTLDAASRTTNGSLVSASGSLPATIHPLSADAGAGAITIRFSNATASAIGLQKGQWLLLRADVGEVPSSAYNGTLARKGEWVQIENEPTANPISVSGGHTTARLTKPLRWEYPLSESAGVKVPVLLPAFAYRNIVLIGPGQAIVPANPANADGSSGLQIAYSERAEFDRCQVYFSERNAIRSVMNVTAFSENCYAEFSRPKSAGQIQYGSANFGTSRLIHHRNFRQLRGRHGIDFSASEGFLEEAVEEGCQIEATYSAAYAEHDGVMARRSINCSAIRCGTGWDYRGNLGPRRNISPIVSVQAQPDDSGTLLGSAYAGFNLRNTAGDIEILSMKVSDAEYVLRADNEGTDPNFTYSGYAPGNVKFFGGSAEQITRGFYVAHNGRQAENGVYNLAVTGPYEFHGVSLRMTGRPSSPSASVRPFSFSGLVGNVLINDCNVDFADTAPYFSVIASGVRELVVSGGRWRRTNGIQVASRSVFNSTGGSVVRQPARFLMTSWPAMVESGATVAFITRPTELLQMPPPLQQSTYSGDHTGNTAKTLLGSIKIPVVGSAGLLKINAAWLASGAGNKTYSIELNGTQIHAVTTSNTGVTAERYVQCQGQSSSKRVVNLGWNVSGSGAGLPAVSVNTASGATIDFYVDLASASDKARLVLGSVEALVND